MVRKIIRFTPDQFGYKDRGKMKWQGLMLSVHTEKLKIMYDKEKNSEPAPKESMTIEEITTLLSYAYTADVPISIQANMLNNGLYYPDIECLVLGYEVENIILKLKDERIFKINLYEIKNVQLLDPVTWYDNFI